MYHPAQNINKAHEQTTEELPNHEWLGNPTCRNPGCWHNCGRGSIKAQGLLIRVGIVKALTNEYIY